MSRKSLEQVGVAVGVAGVDAGRLDRELEARSGGVLGVEVAGAGELVERTPDLGDHGVASNDADTAVRRVDRVATGQAAGKVDGSHL